MKLARFGERLFGHRRNNLKPELPVAYGRDSIHSPKISSFEHDIKLKKLAPRTSERKEQKRETISDLISAYEDSRYPRESFVSSDDGHRKDEYTKQLKARIEQDSDSLYAEVTGNKRSMPDARQPLKRDPVSVKNSIIGSSIFVPALANKLAKSKEDRLVDIDENLTDAQAYVMSVKPMLASGTGVSSQIQSSSQLPIPTYAVAPSFPTASMGMGVIPQVTGGGPVLIPVASMDNNGQVAYWIASPQTQGPFMAPLNEPMLTGASHSTTASRNPFRKPSY